MTWYRKHHTCECGAEWWDEWDCLCNDQCPECGLKDIEPDDHEVISETRGNITFSDVADALSDMIDLADAWAGAGPEGYTPEEQRRRDRADRVLTRLNMHIECGREAEG